MRVEGEEGATGLLMGPSVWELLIVTPLAKGLDEENLKEEEGGGGEQEEDGCEEEEDGILMYGNEVATDIFSTPFLFFFSLSKYSFFLVNLVLGFCLVMADLGFGVCYQNQSEKQGEVEVVFVDKMWPSFRHEYNRVLGGLSLAPNGLSSM